MERGGWGVEVRWERAGSEASEVGLCLERGGDGEAFKGRQGRGGLGSLPFGLCARDAPDHRTGPARSAPDHPGQWPSPDAATRPPSYTPFHPPSSSRTSN